MSVLSDETTRLEIFPPRPGRPFMIHELGVEIVPHVNVRHTEPAVYFDEETTEGLSDSEEEIWLLLRTIRDPEYPFTLAQLRVVSPGFIRVFDKARIVSILFKPTVPHCSLSTLIGLAIRVRIMNDFLVDPAWKLIVQIVPGSHELRHEINKQLMDKERIAAAAENPHVMKIVNDCLALH